MRGRLQRFVQDRTRMLAAISHDLRTPITTLRLRAEFVEDEETRTKLLETLDEMQRMIEATLAFAREEAAAEDTRTVDLAALVESVAADLADLGQQVTFSGPERLPYVGRPIGLKRAVRNLIENAVTYGERARVALERGAAALRIVIDDDGPGIPEADMERVFAPFVRLEEFALARDRRDRARHGDRALDRARTRRRHRRREPPGGRPAGRDPPADGRGGLKPGRA